MEQDGMSEIHIPEPLRALDQWVAWVSKNGKKPPINPRTGHPASPTDPRTWADYGTAREAATQDSNVYAGATAIEFAQTKHTEQTQMELQNSSSDRHETATKHDSGKVGPYRTL